MSWALLREQRQFVSEEQRYASVALADRLHAGPCHFARGNQRVEAARRVICNARRQTPDVSSKRRRNRRSLQVFDRIQQRIKMSMSRSPRRKHALPVREEARQRVLLHWFHFAAQLGQRLAADLAQNFRVAPLAMKTAGTEAAFEHPPFGGKQVQSLSRLLDASSANRSAASRNVNGPCVRA